MRNGLAVCFGHRCRNLFWARSACKGNCKRNAKPYARRHLTKAHLYEAKQLEKACLNFIKENLPQVVGPGFELSFQLNGAMYECLNHSFDPLEEEEPEFAWICVRV